MIAACKVLLLQQNCLAVILVSQYGIEDISFDSGAGSHDVDRGTQQFRCLSASCDDVLGWWLQQSGTFPRLRQLERAVMCVPATSAPAESFSVTGLFMNAKRSSLPLYTRMNKIMFSHDIDRRTVYAVPSNQKFWQMTVEIFFIIFTSMKLCRIRTCMSHV